MLKHADVWTAIDGLARRHGLSPSGLARRAGLDATTFNRSKRVTRDGKLRWPSTESVSKVLDATGASITDFVAELPNAPRTRLATIPVIGHAQAGDRGYFDDAGYPTGSGWDEIAFPDVGDPNAYALLVAGESMEPLYRAGDKLIVSPSSNVRKGDRVVVKTQEGEVMVKVLTSRTARRIELQSLNPDHPDRTLQARDVDWIARILWASQ